MVQVRIIFGIAILVTFAWLISEDRRHVQARDIAAGLLLQLVVALLLLRVPPIRRCFGLLNAMIEALDTATKAGTTVVFGYLGGAELPFEATGAGSAFILASRALPIVLVMSALSALLFHWRVLPFIVRMFSLLLQKSLRIGGALGVGAAANIFVGMVEAPVCIRPYLVKMTRAELFAVMTCGMATIAGTVMALYATLLGDVLPDAPGHLLTASIISAPAAIMIARVLIPETGGMTAGDISIPTRSTSAMDAVTQGTMDGLKLLLNIVAMLIVLVAMVELVNVALGWLPDVGGAPMTLQRMLGIVMAPVVWLLGVPWSEAATAGKLMGTKTVLNEFLAYRDMALLPPGALCERSRLIMAYALCGFANFGSLGIMIGGMSSMVPERRQEIVSLGMRSILAGTMATCMTGAIAGLVG